MLAVVDNKWLRSSVRADCHVLAAFAISNSEEDRLGSDFPPKPNSLGSVHWTVDKMQNSPWGLILLIKMDAVDETDLQRPASPVLGVYGLTAHFSAILDWKG